VETSYCDSGDSVVDISVLSYRLFHLRLIQGALEIVCKHIKLRPHVHRSSRSSIGTITGSEDIEIPSNFDFPSYSKAIENYFNGYASEIYAGEDSAPTAAKDDDDEEEPTLADDIDAFTKGIIDPKKRVISRGRIYKNLFEGNAWDEKREKFIDFVNCIEDEVSFFAYLSVSCC
jgi:hypothetical protein